MTLTSNQEQSQSGSFSTAILSESLKSIFFDSAAGNQLLELDSESDKDDSSISTSDSTVFSTSSDLILPSSASSSSLTVLAPPSMSQSSNFLPDFLRSPLPFEQLPDFSTVSQLFMDSAQLFGNEILFPLAQNNDVFSLYSAESQAPASQIEQPATKKRKTSFVSQPASVHKSSVPKSRKNKLSLLDSAHGHVVGSIQPAKTKTKDGKPRQRSSKACDYCKSRKVKCDGGQPCIDCVAFNKICSYTATATASSVRRASRSSSSTTQSAASEPQSTRNSKPSDSDELTDLIDQFCDYVMPIFPYMSRRLVEKWMAEDEIGAFRLAISAVAMARPKEIDESRPTYDAGNQKAEEALKLIPAVVKSPSYRNLSALLILGYYSAGAGNGAATFNCVKLCVEMAGELGLHTDSPEKFSFAENEFRRRICWCLYGMQSYACMSRVTFGFTEPDVTMPFPQWDVAPEDTPADRLHSQELNFTRYLIQILTIWRHVNTFIDFEDETLEGVCTAELLSSMVTRRFELEKNLLSWFNSIPTIMRNVQSKYYPHAVGHDHLSWRHAVMLGIFHQGRILLHIGPLSRSTQYGLYDVVRNDPNYRTCLDSAIVIAGISRIFLKYNPYSRYAVPIFAKAAVFSIQVFSMAMHVGAPENLPLTKDDMLELIQLNIKTVEKIRHEFRPDVTMQFENAARVNPFLLQITGGPLCC